MKTHLCLPTRVRSNNVNSCTSKTTKRLISPMTLLDRFREAVFRLIMLSAVSSSNKAASHGGGGGRSSTDAQQHYYCPHDDPHHSEAVADCIEFIKKTASPEDGSSGDEAAVDHDMVIPVLVM